MAGGAAAGRAEAEPIAQKKFGNAKAISSKDFEDRSREGDAEKQERLSRFTGASAISSDAYFNRAEPEGPGGSQGSGGSRGMGSTGQGQYGQDMDLTAAELVNRLSFHAKQDMEQVKQMASGAVSKLSNMAGRFMNDMSRY
jgi:ADP-ribosylation factor GTPase-activating protein 2/3